MHFYDSIYVLRFKTVEGNFLGMFLAIDVGGTKTLVAVFTNDGKLKQTIKLKTPKDYAKFIGAVHATVSRLDNYKFQQACVAIPGKIDRNSGVGLAFGNLDWKNVNIKQDLKKFISCPIVIENDANIAGLYEARNIKNDYNRVLYLTVSTGIGSGIIIDDIIDSDFQDSEAGHMMVQFGDNMIPWEDVASGSAIKAKYNKIAKDITDRQIWKDISFRLAIGIMNLIATIQPEVIVIGGGVGTHFNKFKTPLNQALKKMSTPLTPIPPIIQANKPEEAVIYGCYEMAKDTYGQANK